MPTQCVYVFCMDLKTNSDYFTYTELAIFIIEAGRVYCAVRAESLTVVEVSRTV
jgi:hypothetical protein